MSRQERMLQYLEDHQRALVRLAERHPELVAQCAADALRCIALINLVPQLDETSEATLELPSGWWSH